MHLVFWPLVLGRPHILAQLRLLSHPRLPIHGLLILSRSLVRNLSKSIKLLLNLKASVGRSKWVDCSIDLTQFDFSKLPDALNMLPPDAFAENSTGIVLLTRALFAGVHRVRSKSPLLVVLPGGQNDDLAQFGFASSAFATHWMFIKDPLHPAYTRKLCTLVQMGTPPVLPLDLSSSPEWDTSKHLEFHAFFSRRLFASDDAWHSFLATSRSEVPILIRALHTSFTPANVEFYTWNKLDNSNHRVTFRAPSDQKDLLLAASGVQVSFLINLVCRDEASRSSRNSESSVVWLGKLGYAEALVLIKQLDSHLGLALSKQSFGIRCPSSSLHTVRRLVSPGDSKFTDSNIKIRGTLRFVISGLPLGCSRSEIIQHFADWKHGSNTGWAIIPIKQWTTPGQSHWLVKADAQPLAHYYLCRGSRVLIQPADAEKPRRPSKAPKPAPAGAEKAPISFFLLQTDLPHELDVR